MTRQCHWPKHQTRRMQDNRGLSACSAANQSRELRGGNHGNDTEEARTLTIVASRSALEKLAPVRELR
jgi:hypothetical protein